MLAVSAAADYAPVIAPRLRARSGIRQNFDAIGILANSATDVGQPAVAA